jgi:hypothetical protein
MKLYFKEMNKEDLRQIIIDQQAIFLKKEELMEREINLDNYLKGTEIVAITGIRRCGKSSLLKLISRTIKGLKIYINFEDIRLISFIPDNFKDIESIVSELLGSSEVTYFMDEVQNVELWEKWVNNLYAKGIKVFITGSNSNLLSSELSTHLTGRNKVIKLFPFSFKEVLGIKKINHEKNLTSNDKAIILKIFMEYLNLGGFPVIVKNNDLELSRQYFEDIINKDIINRYNIKQIKEFKDLVLYLISNPGRIYSYSTLSRITGIESLSTIKNYIEYLQEAYLLYKVGIFDYSIKKQKTASSKIYAGDNSFLKTVSFNFSENEGHSLENLVFLELLRKGLNIYYHLGKGECDFVIKEGLNITRAIQVTKSLNDLLTKDREIKNLISAMNAYKLKEGIIITIDEEGKEVISGKTIKIIPAWKWMLQ